MLELIMQIAQRMTTSRLFCSQMCSCTLFSCRWVNFALVGVNYLLISCKFTGSWSQVTGEQPSCFKAEHTVHPFVRACFHSPPSSPPCLHASKPYHNRAGYLSILSTIASCNSSSGMGKQFGHCAMDTVSWIPTQIIHQNHGTRAILWRLSLCHGNRL